MKEDFDDKYKQDIQWFDKKMNGFLTYEKEDGYKGDL